MPGWTIEVVLYLSLGLMSAGSLGAVFYYWFQTNYVMMVVFLCYTIANLVLMVGTK